MFRPGSNQSVGNIVSPASRLLAVGLLATLLAAPGSVVDAQGQKGFNYHSFTGEITWRGEQALTLCNGLFVSGRTADQVYAVELNGAREVEPLPRSRVKVDEQLKAVTVGIEDGDPVPAMRAAYREGLGCVVMAPDQTFGDIDELPLFRMAPPPGDAATIAWPDGDRKEAKPLPDGVDRAALEAAGNWAFDRVGHGGHAGQVSVSLLVVYRGQIVYERYAPGFDMSTRTRTWSAAKSILATLVGIAVKQDLLALDKPLPFDWVPKGPEPTQDPRRRITLRNVLNMSSGLYPVDTPYMAVIGSHLSYFGGWDSFYHARDRGLIREPGSVYDYQNDDALLSAAALRAVIPDKQSYFEFPRRVLLDPIGMRSTLLGADRFGNYVMSSQIYTNARDLARLGLLYLNRGRWNGQQILPEEWVDFVRTPASSTRQRGNTYGGHWWLVPDSQRDLPQDAYVASGAQGNYCIVVPSYDLVVVRRGFDWRRGQPGLGQWAILAEVLKAFPPLTYRPKKFGVQTEVQSPVVKPTPIRFGNRHGVGGVG